MTSRLLLQRAELGRYLLALAGPVGSAGANFLLSLVLLRALPPHDWGRFSFLLVASSFAWAVWSALFCAPMPALLANGRDLRGLFAGNAIGSALTGLGAAGSALALGEAPSGALLFGAFAGLSLGRWFARAHAYAIGRQLGASLSDLLYTAALLGGVGLVLAGILPGTAGAWAAMLGATAAGLVPFARTLARDSTTALTRASLPAFGAVWRDHGRWSLAGVVTTEVTVNAHAYLVTLLLGPGAFAPLAAAMLVIRPIVVAGNALTEFERARLATALADGTAEVRRVLQLFRAVLLLAWGVTAVAAAALLAFAPGLVYPASYGRGVIVTGAALWMATAMVRLLSTPEGTLLQAQGRFRPLAMATLWAAPLSVAGVLLALALAPPVWSIAGVVAGETLVLLLIRRAVRR